MQSIGIFCSASNNIDPKYYKCADEFGKWMGEHKKTLVYGGANVGLMDCVSRVAKQYGSRIIGVVPTRILELGKASAILDEMIPCKTLTDRKDILLQKSDVLVALPGGIGTLDEVFHVMAAASLDYHHKKIVFFNIDGFWQGIIDFLSGLEKQHFAHHPLNNYFVVANNINELTELLK
ncbi:MAG: TIGR00730 family Rossman fold protein [Phocaeicola sp.]|uniref:LOG family protein n=1 Tax=Phocaeicola TaxID=909656 RepID=UPI00234E9712|nr:TIGR00730 family Rossman fold protein [Phocaeicola oris]MCE2616876.1 TIGR00730 family Rossman fold protein [Phocaeicola oris]